MLDARIEVDAIPFHKVASACLQSRPTKDAVIEAVLRLMSTHGIPLSEEMSSELKRHKHFGCRFQVLQSQLQLTEGLSGTGIINMLLCKCWWLHQQCRRLEPSLLRLPRTCVLVLGGKAIRRHTLNVRRLPLRRESMLSQAASDGRDARSRQIEQTSRWDRKQVERALGVPFAEKRCP
eukprot:1303383-Amphidinium_carterae.1